MNFRKLKFNYSYLGSPPWDSGISPPELYDFLGHHQPGRALDIGCGTGTNIITMANAGWQVAGFDFSVIAVKMAKQKIRKAHIQADVFADDATTMKNVKGTFDLALDLGCFHGIQNKSDYLTQLTHILNPSGFWLMYGLFNQAPAQPGPGLTEADIDSIPTRGLTLISRTDGFERHERPSAWFLYQLT